GLTGGGESAGGSSCRGRSPSSREAVGGRTAAKTVGKGRGVPLLLPLDGARTLPGKPTESPRGTADGDGRLVMTGVLDGIDRLCTRRRFSVLAVWVLVAVPA